VVRMPGPSWIAYLWMLKTRPVCIRLRVCLVHDLCHGERYSSHPACSDGEAGSLQGYNKHITKASLTEVRDPRPPWSRPGATTSENSRPARAAGAARAKRQQATVKKTVRDWYHKQDKMLKQARASRNSVAGREADRQRAAAGAALDEALQEDWWRNALRQSGSGQQSGSGHK
jgi:hypothetical protein